MFSVIQVIYSPEGAQLDSDSVGEYATLTEANAVIETNYADHMPNVNEERCEWFVIAD